MSGGLTKRRGEKTRQRGVNDARVSKREVLIRRGAQWFRYGAETGVLARAAKLIDWLDELTAECPKKIARNMNDPCGARCRDLARVL